jgi:hypothetical protein
MSPIQKYSKIISTQQMLYSLVLMGISLAIIFSTLVYASWFKRIFTEPKAIFKTLVPKDYTVLKQRRDQVKIDVGLFIRDYSTFDMVKGEITFNGSIFFEFDPYEISLDEIGEFTFARATILEKSLPKTMLFVDKIYARYDIKVAMFSDLEYQYFPFDSHRIDIGLINKSFLTERLNNVKFIGQNSRFHVNHDSVVETPQWHLYHKFVKHGYISEIFNTYVKEAVLYYPVTYFTFEYVKKGMKNALIIVLPIILMLFIGLFALALDQKKYRITSISISTTALSAVIAYRFIIENIQPKVAYFMLSDYLYFIFLIAIFIVFLLSFFMDKISILYGFLLIILIHVIVDSLTIYCILF